MRFYTDFQTPLGFCGILWEEEDVLRIQLPEATQGETIDRLLLKEAHARRTDPPKLIRSSIAQIVQYFAGQPHNFSKIPLRFTGVPMFHQKVYVAARNIPIGQTLTYGDVAAAAGSPKAARGVGQALAKNPFPLVVPCHRVLAAGGKIGGFSAYGGLVTKAKLLELEGVDVHNRSFRRRP